MECDIRFVCIIILSIFLRVSSVDGILLRKGPEDKTVFEGDTVTFECIVASRGASNILWVFEGTRFISVDIDIFGYSDHTGFNERCAIISDVSGQYKLQITNVSKADEGLFECYYTKNRSIGNFGKSSGARLTVLDIDTKTPICNAYTPDPPFRPYQKVVLNCSSTRKDVYVKWDNGTNAMTGFQYSRQEIEIILTPFDNGRIFTCTESNPATSKTQNCSIKPMYIHPMVDIYPRLPEITVNKDITFICNASGLPNIVRYVWIHDGYVIKDGNFYPMKYDLGRNGEALTIRGVGVIDNQSTILCQAYDPSGLYDVASTTMMVKYLHAYLSTNMPLTTRQSTHMTTHITTRRILIADDEYEHISAFAFSLPAVVASVIGICIVFILSVSLLMLACHRRQPKSTLDLSDITTRRGRSQETIIPSVSGGISHSNFIYAELFNEIDFQNIVPSNEYGRQSPHKDEILEPLINGNDYPFLFETHYTSGLVTPPLPPKPTRLIAPDLYTEIPDEIYRRNVQPSPLCDDERFYRGTELSVRSSSETTDNMLDDIYQIPDDTSLIVVPIISEHCHSKIAKRWTRNPSPCGCDEQSRTKCPSYARVIKGNKTYGPECSDFGLGNLERRFLIPLKCDDLTSAELYDVHTPLLDFNTEQELSLNERNSDSIYDVIPESHVQHHHHIMMSLPRTASKKCRSRLRRSKSCPKHNLYEDVTYNILRTGSFVSNLRIAESAPNLAHTQECNKNLHIYETVPDKPMDILYKAKSDDILSKGSSDVSSDYMNMESSDIKDYI